ncbi:MAG: hypothetical protein GXY48_08125 [Methanomicrobiales archaeon]|nr:hypothetical protein [Methanomicrobiales archaeon]
MFNLCLLFERWDIVCIDNRLYCPIGLFIDKNLPQEIALSIMAEIILLMRGGSPEHMRIDWSNSQ